MFRQCAVILSSEEGRDQELDHASAAAQCSVPCRELIPVPRISGHLPLCKHPWELFHPCSHRSLSNIHPKFALLVRRQLLNILQTTVVLDRILLAFNSRASTDLSYSRNGLCVHAIYATAQASSDVKVQGISIALYRIGKEDNIGLSLSSCAWILHFLGGKNFRLSLQLRHSRNVSSSTRLAPRHRCYKSDLWIYKHSMLDRYVPFPSSCYSVW